MGYALKDGRIRTLVFTGRNADVDSGTEEIVPAARGTLPAAAYVASIVSADTNDDGNPVGTGARTVRIIGLNASFEPIEETVTLNGTGAVTTTATFIRVNGVEVVTCGSNGTNVGALSVSLNSQLQATVPAGQGRASGLVFAVPADHHVEIDHLMLHPGELATTNSLRYQLQSRNIATISAVGPWKVLAEGDLYWSDGHPQYDGQIVIPAKHEFRVVAISYASGGMSANSSSTPCRRIRPRMRSMDS